MPEWYDEAEKQAEPSPLGPHKSSDIRKALDEEAYRHLASSGTTDDPYGQLKQADQMKRLSEVQKAYQSIAETGPPLSGEMVRHASDYYDYQSSIIDQRPMQKKGYFGSTTFPGMAQGGMQPFTDPLNSPSRIGIPTWHEEMPDEEKFELQKLARSWCKYFYHSHAVVPTCMSIYSRYPFVGLDIQVPDPQIEAEYKQIFFNQLKYQEMLPQAALTYWLYGEAPMFGRWNNEYAAWSEDRIINPDDIHVITWPGIEADIEAYFWRPPDGLRRLLEEQDYENPIFKYYEEKFGDKIFEWAEGKMSELPRDVFSLLRHDVDLGGNRGYPILMRAFGALMKEEKLNQAMTAVADRLYTPFIVAKLGSENLLQGQYPWMPTKADLDKMQAHIEMVMASKYRVMVYHSGITFEAPFANQTIPNLTEDFDRATKEIMGVFGISPELIYGGGDGTYAAGALSAEFMMQNLSSAQKVWSEWWIRDRARKVAEARGYYVVERKGLTYTKPMERVIEFDPETRTERVRNRRQLMLPSIRMETMDWRDHEQTLRDLMDIRQRLDAPIPNQHFISLIDPNLNLETAREQFAEEAISDYEMRQSLGPAAPQSMGAGSRGGVIGPGTQMPQGAHGRGGMGGPPGAPGMGGPPPGGPGQEMNVDINGENPNGPRPMPGANMPAGGSRPPISDEQRGFSPFPVANIKQAVRKFFGKDKEEDIHIITIGGMDEEASPGVKVADLKDGPEKRELEEKFARMEDDEREQYHIHTKSYKEGTLKGHVGRGAYAEAHMFNHLRYKGTKRGTLYSLNGNEVVRRRVD